MLTKETAELIVEYSRGETAEVYEGYSGRGMYGRKCIGIAFDSISDAIFSIAAAIASVDDAETREAIAEELEGIRWDQMGLGIIIY